MKHKSVLILVMLITSSIIIVGLVFYQRESQNAANIEADDSASSIRNSQTKAYAEEIIADCKSDLHCPVLALENLTKTESRQVVLGTFSDLVLLYDESDYDCHHTAHHLGMWLYGYTTNLEKALSYTKQLCGGGLFHGILQGYFMTEHLHNVDKNQIIITQVCPVNQGNVNWIDRWHCIHGIGHGLDELYDYNTTAAVDRCNEFEPEWAQITCSRGVFMQNVLRYYETGDGDFDKDNINSPCDKTIEKFAPQCYYYHPSYLLKRNGNNLTAAFAQCDKLSPGELAKYCYQGMGRQLSPIVYGNAEQGISDCYLGKQSSYHADCLRGMLRTVLKRDANTDVGFQFCSLSRTDFKLECYEIVGEWIKMLYPNQEEWERECSKAHDVDYVVSCIGANPETWKKES